MFSENIDYKIGQLENFTLPPMMRVEQLFDASCLSDPAKTVIEEVGRLPLGNIEGKRVAISAGSRGVANIALITRTVSDFLKSRGALPFIVPAMGSHARAEAEGQKELLAGYGITEESMDVPILSSMETVQIGVVDEKIPVYCDRNAYEADAIVVVNRVKPHTSLKDEIESGLCKMMAIGLGKHDGAMALHRVGYGRFEKVMVSAAKTFLETGKILFGLGIVENAFDKTSKILAVLPEELIEREKELLKFAKQSMAKLLVDSIDILIVDEIGKDISGGGMDPNVIGRAANPFNFFPAPPIQVLVALSLTEVSHGNAEGVGAADVITMELARSINLGITYTNSITCGVLCGSRMPLIANNDYDALQIAYCGCADVTPQNIKIARIKNTARLEEIELSETYLPFLKGNEQIKILSSPFPFRFSAEGKLDRTW
jgi:hypothetical protein